MPLVTIIIATYNSSATLREALSSVLNQSFQGWECIIVDGASKDNTIEIMEEYCEKDARFRYVSEPDNGIYDAFNKGWRLAKGQWIQYLGSDDKLTKDGLKNMHLEKYLDYPIVTGDVYVMKLDGTNKLLRSVGYGGCHQGKFTRRNILKEMNGFDESFTILADSDLMNRMKHHGYRIMNIPVPVAYFAMGGVSQNLSGELLRARERYRLLCRYQAPSMALGITLRIMVKHVASQFYRSMRKKVFSLFEK
ncbi:PGL/p-HBAD biosynthesis glycosyltransferase [Bacteroidaceae bacterium]|uniref:glycosyltransferase family 2 protein n=1 Tax=uncultured Phocaeicola sp. TaxID=990718 RepID=UPI0014338FC5|nr:glycosyltransferase family 2 protein [uncultured Phocaeicola sp.]GFH99791.1 PGL/p-HBAD biosynthesis glycosyltransferase [Bacteroidaceae bacterium]